MGHSDSYLSTMFDYLYNNGYFTAEELINFNQKAVAHLAHKGKNSYDFIELWKKSNACKERAVDWNEIDTLAKQNEKNWIELIKELDNDN